MSRERLAWRRARIVDACLLLAVLATLWHVAIRSSASPAPRDDDARVGPLTDVGVRAPHAELWTSRDIERTAVLVLDTACPACLASRPLYRELGRIAADTPGTRLIVVSETPIPAVRQWLDEGGVQGRVVRTPSRKALGILSTPTLLLANSEGIVTDISVGMLNQADTARFKARLRGDTQAQPLRLPYSLREASASARPDTNAWIGSQLLDTRTSDEFARAHSPGALNIPEDQLPIRASTQLQRSQPLFLDCRYGERTKCRLTAGQLARQGFADVTVVLR
jgi:rhodanese-related sulfurtransferase